MCQHVAKWLTSTLVTRIVFANDRFTNITLKQEISLKKINVKQYVKTLRNVSYAHIILLEYHRDI